MEGLDPTEPFVGTPPVSFSNNTLPIDDNDNGDDDDDDDDDNGDELSNAAGSTTLSSTKLVSSKQTAGITSSKTTGTFPVDELFF